MNRKLTRILTFLIAFFILFLYSFENVKADDEISVRRRLKVAYYLSDNFQEHKHEDMTKSGYGYEYLQKVAKYTNWEYEYVYGDWADLYNQFLNGEIDLFPGLVDGAHLTAGILCPVRPMDVDNYYIFVRDEFSDIDFEKLTDVTNFRIGCIKDHPSAKRLKEWIRDQGVEAEIVYYNNGSSFFSELQSGAIDGFIAIDRNVTDNPEVKPMYKIDTVKSYLCVRNGGGKILEELNDALDEIDNNEPDFLKELGNKYYSNLSSDINLTGEELKYIQKKGKFVIGYHRDYMPFCGIDINGNVTGVIKDVLDEWCSIVDPQGKLKIEYVPFDGFSEMKSALKNDQVDAIFPAMNDIEFDDDPDVALTNEITSVPFYVAYKGTYSSDTFRKIAMVGVMPHNVQQYYNDSEIIKMKTGEECLDAVVNNDASCAIMSSYRLTMLLQTEDYDDEHIQTFPFGENLSHCFALKRDNHILIDIFNKGVNMLDKSVINNITFSYMRPSDDYSLRKFIKENLWFFMLILIVILGLVVLTLTVSRGRQKKQLAEKIAYEKRIEKSQRELQETDNILSSVGMGIWHIVLSETEAPRMRCNNTLLMLLGISENNMTEEELYIFWYNRIKDTEYSLVNQALEDMKNGKFSEATYVWIHPQLGEQYARCGGTIFSKENSKYVLRGYHCNVTEEVEKERKHQRELCKAKEEAESANAAKTTFLFNMSHDIRTPMNAIIGFTDLLDKNQEDVEKRTDYLKKIRESSSVLLSIINNVLEMARIEKGNIAISEDLCDINVMAEELAVIFWDLMEQKEIKFTKSTNVKHNLVYCDNTKIREVLINLISNAYKYTLRGGTVDFTIEEMSSPEEGYSSYRIIVSDTGMGMSKEFLPTIFEEFSREQTTTETKIEGTGLGMSIVKRLLNLMGGTIEVESELNKGTKFTINIAFKLAKETVKSTSRKVYDDYEYDVKGKRILLAEDNDLNAEIATAVLEEAGIIVERAEDGMICVEMMEQAEPGYYEMILMDVQMPRMNGYEATKKIREFNIPKKANIPIIAMTANAFEEDKREAIECGMDGHLAKPINVKVLIKEIAALLTR